MLLGAHILYGRPTDRLYNLSENTNSKVVGILPETRMNNHDLTFRFQRNSLNRSYKTCCHY